MILELDGEESRSTVLPDRIAGLSNLAWADPCQQQKSIQVLISQIRLENNSLLLSTKSLACLNLGST